MLTFLHAVDFHIDSPVLQDALEPMGKSAIGDAVARNGAVIALSWPTAIHDLLGDGRVIMEGEGKGAKYRITARSYA